ncbi:MAG: hypothetical protein J0L69_12970 [Bacteroidetes bacterium]|nr:hypothetical protein [Bacteroidota bacterium]
MSLDIETAKYLAEKSNQMIERQISSYRDKRSVASTIMGLCTLFIPFYLSGLFDSLFWIQIVAIFPLILVVLAIFFLLKIYYMNSLEQGLALSKYDEAINKKHDEAILFEIAVNRDCYNANRPILDGATKNYEKGLSLTKWGIGLSIIVLSLNLYFRPSNNPEKIELVNPIIMTMGNNNNNSGNNQGNNNEPSIKTDPIVIPSTNPSDRERLSEGIDPKKGNDSTIKK